MILDTWTLRYARKPQIKNARLLKAQQYTRGVDQKSHREDPH
jgi:hypothetical protein